MGNEYSGKRHELKTLVILDYPARKILAISYTAGIINNSRWNELENKRLNHELALCTIFWKDIRGERHGRAKIINIRGGAKM